MRVLLSAYQCGPYLGSEPRVGWAMLSAAANNHDVVLLTQPHYVDELRDNLLSDANLRSVEIVPIGGMRCLRRFEGMLGLGHLDYVVWQYRAWRVARRLQFEVDVAHHVTLSNDWLPCAVHFLHHVPIVWGPVGGAAQVPWRLAPYLSAKGLVREAGREMVSRTIRRFTARVLERRRSLVVAVNHDSAACFASAAQEVVVAPHVAVAPAPSPGAGGGPACADDNSPPLVKRVVFAARLLAWKGPYLALQTLACLPMNWTLDMYGLGPEMRGLQHKACRLGVAHRVRFLGHRPVEELRSALERADVLLFPSMHDASPFTVAEAVRLGCPVVCLDVGGPPLLIAGAGGRAVPATRRAPMALAEAIHHVERQKPDDRWNGRRLIEEVSDWYEQAQSLPGTP